MLKVLVRKSKKTEVSALLTESDEDLFDNDSDALPVEWSEVEEPELHELIRTPEEREADLKRIEEEMKNGTYQPPLF